MCTVTIVPKSEKDFIFTSNRDEAPSRTSLEPKLYVEAGTQVVYPKDVLSGGTWIGVSEKNRLVCVLNGGSKKHGRQATYRKSRGLVAKDFLVTNATREFYEDYDFSGIEPFTMVIVEWDNQLKLYELILNEDGHIFNKLPLKPKIWSSSTLYNNAMKRERQDWFEKFISENPLDAASILEFHKTAGRGNLDYGVVMDRGFVKTTSRTQVEKTADFVEMRFENLKDHTQTKQSLSFSQVINE